MPSFNFCKWFLEKKIFYNSEKKKKLLPSHFVLLSSLLGLGRPDLWPQVVYPTSGSVLDIQGPPLPLPPTPKNTPNKTQQNKKTQKGKKNSLYMVFYGLLISMIRNPRIFSKTIVFC